MSLAQTPEIFVTAEPGFQEVLSVDIEQTSELARRARVPEPGLRIHIANGLNAQVESEGFNGASATWTEEIEPYSFYDKRIRPSKRTDFVLAFSGLIGLRDELGAFTALDLVGNLDDAKKFDSVPTVELLFGKMIVQETDFEEQERLMRVAVIMGALNFMPEDHWVYRKIPNTELPKPQDFLPVLPKRRLLGRILHARKDALEAEVLSARSFRRQQRIAQSDQAERQQLQYQYALNLSKNPKFGNLVKIV